MLIRGDIDDAKTHTVEEIAAVFGVEPGWLAYGTEPSPSIEAIRAAVGAAGAAPAESAGPVVDRSPEFDQERAS